MIFLYGRATCSYDVLLDNTSYSFSPPLSETLFSKNGLTPGVHTLKLTVHPSVGQQAILDRVVVGSDLYVFVSLSPGSMTDIRLAIQATSLHTVGTLVLSSTSGHGP